MLLVLSDSDLELWNMSFKILNLGQIAIDLYLKLADLTLEGLIFSFELLNILSVITIFSLGLLKGSLQVWNLSY